MKVLIPDLTEVIVRIRQVYDMKFHISGETNILLNNLKSGISKLLSIKDVEQLIYLLACSLFWTTTDGISTVSLFNFVG